MLQKVCFTTQHNQFIMPVAYDTRRNSIHFEGYISKVKVVDGKWPKHCISSREDIFQQDMIKFSKFIAYDVKQNPIDFLDQSLRSQSEIDYSTVHLNAPGGILQQVSFKFGTLLAYDVKQNH